MSAPGTGRRTGPDRASRGPGTSHDRTRFGGRGVVLVTCLLLLAALTAAGAASLWLTRSELWAAGSARAARQARYSAEAGIRHALAVIAPGAGFAALLAGSGGLADPSRPGPLPLAGGGWVEFPGPPFGYAVTLTGASAAADGSARLRLESTATAVRGARHRVRGFVARRLDPYVPAALVVTSGTLELAGHAVGSGALPGVVLDARSGEESGVAALAAATEAGLAAAVQACDGAFVARHGTPRHALARPFDVAAHALELGLTTRPVEEVEGTFAGAALTAVRTAGGEIGILAGRGVLVVDGDLTVAEAAVFEGALLVGGRLRLEAEACALDGMVWAGAVELAAGCRITFDAAAVAAADAALSLPRLPMLLALEDVELP